MEQGTQWVHSITTPGAGNTVIIANITQAEIVSGASRRRRIGQISDRTAHAVRLVIDRHASREYMVVILTDQVLRQAEDLLEKHPLRAYDAIQLASALISNQQLLAAGLPFLVFVSADRQLLSAAASEGLNTENPNDHA